MAKQQYKSKEIVFDPNQLFFDMYEFYMLNKDNLNPLTNEPSRIEIACAGSGRSGKSFSIYQLIYTLCCANNHERAVDKSVEPLSCYVVRKTLKSSRELAFKEDFKSCLRFMRDFQQNCVTGENQSPVYDCYGSTIKFIGMDGEEELGKSDIIFYNEVLDEDNEERFEDMILRCKKLVLTDWNPKYSFHWVFKREGRFNTFFTKTTFWDNKFCPASFKAEIMSRCPYDFSDWDFENKRWKTEDENLRPINTINEKNGTINKRRWLIYGEGEQCPEAGAIYQNYKWVDEFPESGFDEVALSIDFGFACFEGNTPIFTNIGEKYIKDIKQGDFVLTSSGYNKVLKVNRNGIKKVYEIKFGFDFGYRKINCTFDHKFKTTKGWKQLKDLTQTDVLYLNAFTMEKDMCEDHIQNTLTTSMQQVQKKYCIEKFGKLLMAKFQKIKLFTILIAIHTTTKLQTLCLRQYLNTQKYTDILKGVSEKMDTQKRIGIREGLLLLKNYNLLEKSVHPVEVNLLRQTLIRNIVQVNVITNINTHLLNLASRIFVSFAELLSKGISILNKELVHQSVDTPLLAKIEEITELNSYYTEVFDLTVENEHEYFANGILVHNCDPTVLGRTGRQDRKLWDECMSYEPTPTPQDCFDVVSVGLEVEEARRIKEYASQGITYNGNMFIWCDSADKDRDDEEYVIRLNEIARAKKRRWNFIKTSKIGIRLGIDIVQSYDLHFVKNQNVKMELENYVWKIIEGRVTNIPIDKLNHNLDRLRYAVVDGITDRKKRNEAYE